MAPESSRRRARRKRGELLVRTVPLLVNKTAEIGGSDEQVVPIRLLHERVSWLLDLVAQAARDRLATHWDSPSIDALQGGAQYAYKQLERTLGLPPLASGVVAPSRVRWLAGEVVGRTLRSAAHRRDVVSALLADDLSLLPKGVDAVTLRNQRKRLNRYAKREARPALSLFDLEPDPPKVTPQLLLAATDRQLCSISDADEEGHFTLDLYLPTCASPASYADWSWHRLAFHLPDAYIGRAPRRPTLRLSGKRLLADVPVEMEAPAPVIAKGEQATRVLSADWGVNTLL
ncbi:MAG: hypothetical protein ACRDHE_03390, partial [Ktedonobacterales bacterium]